MPELPANLHEAVDRHAEEGNQLMDKGDYVGAETVFRRGLALLPEPKSHWEATLWFLAGIGDAQWSRGDHEGGRDTWRDALLNGGVGNAFVHLRRGQTLYELGLMKESANELLRALLLGGEELLANEDPKFLEYVTSTAAPPEGFSSWRGWKGVDPDSPVHDWLMDSSAYELELK
jgi:hypothetical protein